MDRGCNFVDSHPSLQRRLDVGNGICKREGDLCTRSPRIAVMIPAKPSGDASWEALCRILDRVDGEFKGGRGGKIWVPGDKLFRTSF